MAVIELTDDDYFMILDSDTEISVIKTGSLNFYMDNFLFVSNNGDGNGNGTDCDSRPDTGMLYPRG